MVIYKQDEIDSIEFELRNNKAAIVDTDTVMGIVSLDKKNIYKIKKRPRYKKLVIFLNDFENSGIFSNTEVKVLKKYWPGKLTVVKNRIGYRVPNDKCLLDILSRVGFLYSSSANISGAQPITSLKDINKMFKKTNLLFAVDNKITHNPEDKPSTIINLDNNKVLRKGNIDGLQVLKEINNEK